MKQSDYELLRLLPPRPDDADRLRFAEPLPLFDEPARDPREEDFDSDPRSLAFDSR